MKKKAIISGFCLLFLSFLAFPDGQKDSGLLITNKPAAQKAEVVPLDSRKKEAVYNSFREAHPAKYVFLFIGDGMGLTQVAAAEIYAENIKENNNPAASRRLAFTGFPAQGITTTYDAGSFITDSASAGTAIACGHKTLNGVIAMDTEKKHKYKSVAYLAKEKNMKVGIVTSVSIDHATPAVFYANQPSRNNMYEIALSLADSGFDYFGGGGLVDPDGLKSKMENKPGNAFAYARSKGYKIANTREEIMGLQQNSGKVWAITEKPSDASSMLYEMDRKEELALADFTAKGIELLDNPKGFFMMVEGGKIDWACHANDALAAICDVFAFDDAVKVAVKFAEKHPDETLIVVTADHETGGMTIGYAGTGYDTFFNKLQRQQISFQMFNDILPGLKKYNPQMDFAFILPQITGCFGLTARGDNSEMDLTGYESGLIKAALAETLKEPANRATDDSAKLHYGGYEPLTITLTHILNNKAGIGWTTYSHTGVPVPTYAYGTGQDLFDGYYDNTDIFLKLISIMKIKN